MSETSDIVTPIIRRLEARGYKPERVQSGTARGGRTRLAPPGTPDIHVTIAGRCVYLEAKTAVGKVSEVQHRRHAELRRQGARVEVVRSVAEAELIVARVLAAEKVSDRASVGAPDRSEPHTKPSTESEDTCRM